MFTRIAGDFRNLWITDGEASLGAQEGKKDRERRRDEPNRKTLAIVLSGGDGERMRQLTEKWLGSPRPKQYCTFVGTRSMLEHTLDRVSQIVPPERVLTVIGEGRRKYLASDEGGDVPGWIIEQPEDRGTAPGILLPATYVMAADPEATVLIFPSDHFVYPEDRFLEHVVRAGLAAQSVQDRIVLLGAETEFPETEYGWIQPGRMLKAWSGSSRESVREVAGFEEKLSLEKAQDFFNLGYLWNTMIMAVKVKTLWQLGLRFFPHLISRFEILRRVLQATQKGRGEKLHEEAAISHVYRLIRSQNFSHDFLERATPHAAVLCLSDVIWSDWGRKERIIESLARLGKKPLFSAALPLNSKGVLCQM